jgi:protein-S-isoprenylcysteine O-methyltransferase Ste14
MRPRPLSLLATLAAAAALVAVTVIGPVSQPAGANPAQRASAPPTAAMSANRLVVLLCVITLLVVVMIVLFGGMVTKHRRRRLRAQFGDEYDEVVSEIGSEPDAQRELLARAADPEPEAVTMRRTS